jgi:hypothetical protein
MIKRIKPITLNLIKTKLARLKGGKPAIGLEYFDRWGNGAITKVMKNEEEQVCSCTRKHW